MSGASDTPRTRGCSRNSDYARGSGDGIFPVSRRVREEKQSGADQTAVKGAITSTGYTSNQVEVKLDIDDWEVVVRPSNLLSRALSIVGVAKRPR